ncbi:AsnC family transcriptional regulator [Candidatus Pacearchaeota archaeon]|nr:MAG: AsnC family transcriptional regulator [Candidatus Pacearchaeota archaeon]
MTQKIDELDIKIIRELRKDARQSFYDLAKKLKVAEGTIYNRVNKLQESGVIKGYSAKVDFSKLGYDLVVIIGVSVKGKHLIEIEKEIAKEKNVSAVYDVTGEYDAIIVANFKTRDELNKFVKKILGMKYVKRTYTMLVLNIWKDIHGVDI